VQDVGYPLVVLTRSSSLAWQFLIIFTHILMIPLYLVDCDLLMPK